MGIEAENTENVCEAQRILRQRILAHGAPPEIHGYTKERG